MNQRTVTHGNTEFYIDRIDAKMAIVESCNVVGARPPHDGRVYDAAIAAGAHSEWRIMKRRTDRPNELPRVHLVHRSEYEALVSMRTIQAEAEAYAELMRSMS